MNDSTYICDTDTFYKIVTLCRLDVHPSIVSIWIKDTPKGYKTDWKYQGAYRRDGFSYGTIFAKMDAHGVATIVNLSPENLALCQEAGLLDPNRKAAP